MKKTTAKPPSKIREVSREMPSRKRFKVTMEVEGDMLDKDTPISEESIAALFQLQYQSEKVLKLLKIDVRSLETSADVQDETIDLKPDFEITKIIKFDSKPPKYKVFIRMHGEKEDHAVEPISARTLTDVIRFRRAFFESTQNKWIASLSQWLWEQLVSAAALEVRGTQKAADGK